MPSSSISLLVKIAGWIASTVDVQDSNNTVLDPLPGSIFPDFNVSITFRGQVVAPPHTGIVVVVKWSGHVRVSSMG